MTSFALLVLFVVCLNGIGADEIGCLFRNVVNTHKKPLGYGCEISTIKQKTSNLPNSIRGRHSNGRDDFDVKAVHHSWLNTRSLNHFDSIFCQKFINLESIELNNIKIAALNDDALDYCQHLSSLKLNRAELVEIPENFLAKSTKLTHLGLFMNQLSTMPENVFESQRELRELRLNENKIKILKPGWFESLKSLEELFLNNNKIEDLPADVFGSMVNLKALWLSGNEIKVLHADSFGRNGKLTMIDLGGNELTAIDEDIVDDTAIVEIRIKDNHCTEKDDIKGKAEMREKLWMCFKNYQPREE